MNILLCFHTPTNTGYAIEPLERIFFEIASAIPGAGEIVLGYHGLENGKPRWAPADARVVDLHYRPESAADNAEVDRLLAGTGIDVVFAFDLPVAAGILRQFRRGGVKAVGSYWGAPMSSLNSGIKLQLKRLEVLARRDNPDVFVFESRGMRDTAVNGRGIPAGRTRVVPLGFESSDVSPGYSSDELQQMFGIPPSRRIVFYAGHMEPRKGVHVLVDAVGQLVNERARDDVHLLICGNTGNQSARFDGQLDVGRLREYVTFAGYRNDIPRLIKSSYLGVIASTEWDSFPRTSLEIQCFGVPLLVSDIPGLNETIGNGETGFLFPRGDARALADRIQQLLDDPAQRERMGSCARTRVESQYSLAGQREKLRNIMLELVEIARRRR